MNSFNNDLKLATYTHIADKIIEELDSRGFTSENPEASNLLIEKIVEIIEQTMNGNTNYIYGWENDLINQ